jgi:plastocyanin
MTLRLNTLAAPAVAQAATPGAFAFTSAIDILNYALALEHLENAFYRDGLQRFANQDFLNIGLQTSVRDYLSTIVGQEVAHVDQFTKVIQSLGGKPVAEATYDFGYADLSGFLKVAAQLENTGVAAYTGVVHYLLGNSQLTTAVLTIQGVEARHAAYTNLLTDLAPFPAAFEPAKTPPEVLALARPFMVSATATPALAATAVAGASTATVSIENFAFLPGVAMVKTGGTVTWTNQDIVPHTVTADDGSFDSGSLAQGAHFSHTFQQAGTVAYHCKYHGNMHASVTVS